MNTDSQHLQQVSEEFQHMVEEFFLVQSRYSAAIKEIQTKLEILDDEFQMRHHRNPIHHMQSRLKTIQSMLEKLKRKNYEVSINSAVKNLQDIAGIRVICSYVQDVYTIANLLVSQDDVHLVRMADYIREPKPNGYRSLHLIVEIPVFLSEGRILVPVEVQIRTIAMDFWASLEHSLRYKAQEYIPQHISDELQRVATDIASPKKLPPQVDSRLRHSILEMPIEIRKASGIVIYGRRIKSLVFTTDLAIIKNCDADAVFAVYPFTPQQSISDAIIKASYIPVFCGVGGGTTQGLRTVSLAKDAEAQGAMGVVLNAPVSNLNLLAVSKAVDIPVIITVIDEATDIGQRIASGASILNVAGGANTPAIVRKIRTEYPDFPIIATGGNKPDTIAATVAAGANAITFTPPSAQELFKAMMTRYRDE